MKYITQVNNRTYHIEVNGDGSVTVDGERHAVQWQRFGAAPRLSLLLGAQSYDVVLLDHADHWDVLVAGERHQVQVLDELAYRVAQARHSAQATAGVVTVASPMPGLVLRVLVEEGARVERGEKLVILESMKMENELRAPRAGRVLKVAARPGASVEKGQALITIGDAG